MAAAAIVLDLAQSGGDTLKKSDERSRHQTKLCCWGAGERFSAQFASEPGEGATDDT